MWKLGAPGEPPPAPPGQQVYDQLGMHACTAALVALRERPRVGGQFVELSLHEMLAAQDAQVSRYARTARFLARRQARLGAPPTGVWACKDGSIELMAHNPGHWYGFLRVIGTPEDLSDEALADRNVRLPKEEWLAERIAHYMAPFTVAELLDRFQAERMPCAPWYLPEDFVEDSQPVSRGFWVDLPRTGGGTFRAPGRPFRADPDIFAADQPSAGNEPGVTAAGSRRAEPPRRAGRTGTADRPAVTDLPIKDIKVLSFGQVIAGNLTAMALAELGADVVKIESPRRADPNRVSTYTDEPKCLEPGGHETNSFFASFSRSVQSITLDMAEPADVERFHALLARADVLLENFGGGVMERWGLTPQHILAANPRVVYLSISGYGRTGPRAPAAAYGANIGAYLGLTRCWVTHGTHIDYESSATAVAAVLAALAWRDRSGRGVYLDLAQSEAAAAMMAPIYLGVLNHVDGPDLHDGGAPSSVLAGVFRCAGDEAWVAVEVRDDRDRRAAAALVGGDADRDLRGALAAWCECRTPHQAMFELQHAGVPAGAVRNGEELFLDPQHAARGAFVEIAHPDLGPLVEPRPLYRMSRTDVAVRRPSPRVGEHTDAVVHRWSTAR
jgi:crotonobetainyl-CoA:carnitine CoA-transferase CaiB-like acyl-CoA transferase